MKVLSQINQVEKAEIGRVKRQIRNKIRNISKPSYGLIRIFYSRGENEILTASQPVMSGSQRTNSW